MNDISTHCASGCCTKICGLSVKYGGALIIHDINLHFHCGEFTVISGPNGAGKTTLLKTVAGEIRRYKGKILFHKHGSEKPKRPRIGYVPQKFFFDATAPLSVEDLFAISLSKKPAWIFRDKEVIQTANDSLATVGARHLLKKKLGKMSGGELQRVMLSLALTPRPDILLLDEPISGIDADGHDLFYATVSELRNRYDLSIIMVSHDIKQAVRYADRIITLNKTVISDVQHKNNAAVHHA